MDDQLIQIYFQNPKIYKFLQFNKLSIFELSAIDNCKSRSVGSIFIFHLSVFA